MSDSRRWEHLRSIGAVLADRTFSLNSLRSDVADAAGYFETATAAEPTTTGWRRRWPMMSSICWTPLSLGDLI